MVQAQLFVNIQNSNIGGKWNGTEQEKLIITRWALVHHYIGHQEKKYIDWKLLISLRQHLKKGPAATPFLVKTARVTCRDKNSKYVPLHERVTKDTRERDAEIGENEEENAKTYSNKGAESPASRRLKIECPEIVEFSIGTF